MERRCLSIEEFGHIYGVRRTKTYALLRSGEIKACKIGRRTLVTVESAESFYNRSIQETWDEARSFRRSRYTTIGIARETCEGQGPAKEKNPADKACFVSIDSFGSDATFLDLVGQNEGEN